MAKSDNIRKPNPNYIPVKYSVTILADKDSLIKAINDIIDRSEHGTPINITLITYSDLIQAHIEADLKKDIDVSPDVFYKLKWNGE